MTKTVIAGALGECVHGAGASNFLRLAEAAGWGMMLLRPDTPIETFIKAARPESTDLGQESDLLIGISYRLTPETGQGPLGQSAEEMSALLDRRVRFAVARTPPVVERAQNWISLKKLLKEANHQNEFCRISKGRSPRS